MDSFKLEIYFEVLRIFEEDLWDEKWGGIEPEPRYICHTFRHVLEDLGATDIWSSDLKELFKEFFDLFDGIRSDYGYYFKGHFWEDAQHVRWWPDEDKEARIRILNFIISNRLGS